MSPNFRFDKIETVTVCIFTVEYAQTSLWLPWPVRLLYSALRGFEVLRFSTQAGSCLTRIKWVVPS